MTNLISSKISPNDFIDDLFADEENNEVLLTTCQYYHQTKGESPDLTDIKIKDISFDVTRLTGEMQTEYILAYQSVPAINNTAGKLTWQFTVDPHEMTVHFIGKDIPVRSAQFK